MENPLRITIDKSEYDYLIKFNEYILSGDIKVIYGLNDKPCGFNYKAELNEIKEVIKVIANRTK